MTTYSSNLVFKKLLKELSTYSIHSYMNEEYIKHTRLLLTTDKVQNDVTHMSD
jgi:hypothetical protein